MEEQEIDWSDMASVLAAAKPFDRSYTPDRPVMLAASELANFCRHYFGKRHVAEHRRTDPNYDRVKELESDNKLLQAENTLLLARLRKDRRQKETPVEVDRRH